MNKLVRWRDIEGNEAIILQAELKRELCPDHPLHGQRAEPWLISWTNFNLSDGKVALFHLTYNRETHPDYPAFKGFASKAKALPRLALLEAGEAYE